MWCLIRNLWVGLLLVMQVALAQADGSQQVELLNQEVVKLYQAGKYSLALEKAQQVLAIAEKVFGPEHPATSTFLSNLALVYKAMGAYEKALLLCVRALEIAEKALGPEHPETGISLNNLAGLYRAMGAYDTALPLSVRSLTIAENALGPEHPETSTSLNNLALLYRAMGAYEKALPLSMRALAIAENGLGAEHPSTSGRLSSLAELYRAMGAYEKALPLSVRALTIAENALGAEHPETSHSLNSLALLYKSIGAYEKALPLYKRALAIAEKAFGAEHPSTGICLNNLAGLYNAMDSYEKALPLYVRALAIAEKALGPEHPDTSIRLNNLAGVYRALGAYEKSLPLYARALAIAEKALGLEHPETAIRLSNFAELYRAMGAYEKALPLYARALAIAEKVLGPEHPETGTHLNNLAVLYESMGAYDKALPLYVRVLAIAAKAEGEEHPSTGASLNNLAALYFAFAEYEKALPLYLRSFAIAVSRVGTAPELLAQVAQNLCFFHQTSNRREAIFYCKLAVNTRQTQRHNAKTMDKELQRTLHAKTQSPYLLLNSLLTDAQRYFEAEEVLRAMKADEINEATRAETVASKPLSQTKTEAALAQEFTELGQTLARQLQEKERLKNLPDAQIQRDKNQHQVDLTKEKIMTTLAAVSERLKEVDQEAAQVFSVKDTKSYQLANTLAKEAPQEGNLIVFINADEEKTTVNIVTQDGYHPFSIAVGMKQLAPLIGKMRNAILDKTDAYREPAQQIYQLLFAPIEARPEFKAKTLTLFLNGRLRGLPVAALLDAKGTYFVQKYRFGLYNIVAQDKAADVPQNWRVQAWGNPKAYPEQGLRALPAVGAELQQLVRQQPGKSGILPGKRYLGADFSGPTWRAMLQQSSKVTNAKPQSERSVLHVATHFKLVPGNLGESQLFLGDDSKFTLANLQAMVLDLSDVDLLTLSACHSLSYEKSNSNEFESLGATFQSKGVKAVLGTLWAVQDASTAELMQQFYAARGEQRKMSKAQALQQAQQKMIGSKDWSHPYYWSGFVLMGNWL